VALRILLNGIIDEADAHLAAVCAARFAAKHPGRSHTNPGVMIMEGAGIQRTYEVAWTKARAVSVLSRN
jgi:hypothetical protein